MRVAIIDCYTDEPAGLGVPPYLGTYPRYLAGALELAGHSYIYLTIDDLRALFQYSGAIPEKKLEMQTNIRIYNLTRRPEEVRDALEHANELIVIAGIQVPGKYLSALPGTLHELKKYLPSLKARKVLTGPAANFGTRLEGGKSAEEISPGLFDEVTDNYLGINNPYPLIREMAVAGAGIVKQVPWTPMIELETGKGCIRKIGCSFCTEPLKNRLQFRDADDVIAEAKALYTLGQRHFRIGKQTDFYSYQGVNVEKIEYLLKTLRNAAPELKTLVIDNTDPLQIIGPRGGPITELIVKYCTEGNTAAMGAESFDPEVVRANNLKVGPELIYKAVEILNKHGRERGNNGMPKFLPGINLVYGLINESRETNSHNLKWLRKMLDNDLWVRRINIRQAAVFPGTQLAMEAGTKFLRKNRKLYYRWRDDIRQQVDFPMLDRIAPIGHVLRDVYFEIYDGNHTFGRHFGTYPLIIGLNKRVPLGGHYEVRVTKHMLRSVTAEPILERPLDATDQQTRNLLKS
ncbi:radical SAM protein [Candidatus Woesearchaeota archaeon]|nr:radical SAM protein [Candidatus Woesearchaeota archaeon]